MNSNKIKELVKKWKIQTPKEIVPTQKKRQSSETAYENSRKPVQTRTGRNLLAKTLKDL